VVVGKLLEAKEYGYGYDAQTGEYGDLAALGIIDPTKVVRTALQNAASIAGMIVTTEATITEHPRRREVFHYRGAHRGEAQDLRLDSHMIERTMIEPANECAIVKV
jgi:chaperonin GroEL (HSP60 family)